MTPAKAKASFSSLPVEVIERIIAKCEENDAQILESETATLLERAYGPNSKGKQKSDGDWSDDNGWETESEDEDDSPSREATADVCDGCGEVHDYPVPSGKSPKRDPSNSPILAIKQLTLVSKDLRELALPKFYADLDFEDRPNRTLERYWKTIMPKYGQFVKRFWVRISVTENQEFTAISWEDAEDTEEFEPRYRYFLASTILSNLTNLVEIDIDLPRHDQPIREYMDKFWETTAARPYGALVKSLQEDIAERGKHLTSLHITSDAMEGSIPAATICALLGRLPNLWEIELSGVGEQGPTDTPKLGDIVASMQHLQCIEFDDVQALDDDWANADWQSKLQVISLEDCQIISEVGLEKLIQRHASSLKGLNLVMTPPEPDFIMNTGPSLELPNLRELAVDNIDLGVSYVQRFAICPQLTRIELGELQSMEAKDLLQMIETNKSGDTAGFPALKELVLAAEWAETSDATMESLELVCFENGITLVINEPDSDDEYYSDEEALDDISEMDDDEDGDEGDFNAWEDDEDSDESEELDQSDDDDNESLD